MARKNAKNYDEEWGDAPKPKGGKKKGRSRADNPHKLMEIAQNADWDELYEDEFYE